VTKICKTCRMDLPFSEFHACPTSKDRLQYSCRKCRIEIVVDWQKKNKERHAQKNKRYYENNLDRVRTNSVRNTRAWRKRNPEKAINQVVKRRKAIAIATPPWADLNAIAAVYLRAKCLSNGAIKYHVDHEIPLRGNGVCGLHVQNNLRIVTAQENQIKSNSFSQ
jgi:hypothetical protein